MDLEREMRLAVSRLEPRLEALLQGGPPALLEAMRYAVLGGGKRLRPILCLWTHELFHGDESLAALDAACALEFVHTYSLVHDDLPCMDDDALRRGRPTCHVRFGEALAVLAGDGLLNLAYETVLGAAWIHAERGWLVARTLVDAASHRELVGGQALDLEAEGETPSEARVHAIHAAKTAALLRASLLCGALAAGAGAEILVPLGKAGTDLGLAFQIADDVLDVTGGAATLGKSPGKDADAGKMTYTALVGLEAARQDASRYAKSAQKALAQWPGSERLRALAGHCVDRAR